MSEKEKADIKNVVDKYKSLPPKAQKRYNDMLTGAVIAAAALTEKEAEE